MGMEKPINGSGRNGYVYPDGTVKNEYFVTQRAKTDDAGKYVLIHGHKHYVHELVEKHFGKPSAEAHRKKAVQEPDGGGESDKQEVKSVEAKPMTESAPEPEADRVTEPAPEAKASPVADETSSTDEIGLIADIFRQHPKYTYAQILKAMHEKGYKVSRNQIAEGKRQAGLLD